MSAPVYLVLGAAGGIGSTLCRHLTRKEFRVALAGRDGDKLESLAKEIDSDTEPAQSPPHTMLGTAITRAERLTTTLLVPRLQQAIQTATLAPKAEVQEGTGYPLSQVEEIVRARYPASVAAR